MKLAQKLFSLSLLCRCLVPLLAAFSLHADSPSKNETGVMSPAQAGRVFLSNAQNFIASDANTTTDLDGRVITADFADGNFRVQHRFQESGRKLSWEVLTGKQKGAKGTVDSQVFEVRPGIYFIMTQPASHEAVSLVIDENRGVASGFLSRYSDKDRDRLVSLTRIHGPVLEAKAAGNDGGQLNDADLGGTRFTVVYPGEVAIYEHIYLNQHYMTWLGHKGTSAGVADTERYEAIEVAPLLYLVAWNEKSAPLQISMLFDFARMSERATIFGFDEANKRTVYQTTSAKIRKISHTLIPGLK